MTKKFTETQKQTKNKNNPRVNLNFILAVLSIEIQYQSYTKNSGKIFITLERFYNKT